MIHITPHPDGMVDMVVPSAPIASDIVIMGNVTHEGTKVVGKILGIICDNNGNKKHVGALNSVYVMPEAKHNLLIIL
jgi:hypothetical protein